MPRAIRQPNVWYRIQLSGCGHVHELSVTRDLRTARMDSLVAKSKYHTIPGFADRREGHIVLQDHGDEVWYRSLKLREIKP